MPLRGAVQIVAAEDLLHLGTIEQHQDIATYERLHGRDGGLFFNVIFRVCRHSVFRLAAQTAAVGIAVDGTAIEVYLCLLRGIDDKVFSGSCGVGVTQSRATIDIAPDRDIACIDRDRIG